MNEKNSKTSIRPAEVATKDVQISLPNGNEKNAESKLGCLENVNQLCIKKGIKLGLSQTHVHTEIYNSQNQTLFKAKEQIGNDCIGCFYYPNRWLDMDVVDLCDEDVLHLSRDKRTRCLWRACNLSTLEIFLSSRRKIGTMRRISGCWSVKYNIEDETGNCILKIRRVLSFPYGYFNILSEDKTEILGKIKRDRPESHHVFSRNYSVHVTFPVSLDVKIKAVLLGATLTLISTYFEESE